MPETPKLTADVIVRVWDRDRFRGIVLIERRNFPPGLALPGGFVEVGETVEQAAAREVQEETGLEIRLGDLLGIYSQPDRDPRFHTASAVFVGDAEGEPRGGSDSLSAQIFALEEVPLDRLVFDHRRILVEFMKRGRR